MKITVTFDQAIYKLVPIEPTGEMFAAEQNAWNQLPGMTASATMWWALHKAMLAAVPGSLLGVVIHSGDPLAYAWYHRGMVNFDAQGDLSLLDDEKGTPIELFAHPAPDANAIITATLEVAAKAINTFGFCNGRPLSEAIRALSPQDILNSMEGK